MHSISIPLILLMVISLLNGCAAPSMADLEEYVASIKKKPSSTLKELPKFPTEESYQYQGIKNKKPDPFISFEAQNNAKEIDDVEVIETLDCPRPDKYRSKQQLELFPRDGLLMVGSLSKGGKIWGLILDPDGNIHRVEENFYLGKRYGRIISIEETHIELLELHKDKRGCFEEVQVTISLKLVD